MKPAMLLEVIVQSVADATAAESGGADRLEVVRAIERGGLTPSIDLVRAIKSATGLPLRVMVREHDGFELEPRALPALRRAAGELAAAGVDGLVIGFARAGEVSLDDVAAVLDAAPGLPATFHRAFDGLADPGRAIESLRTVAAIDRILTSGCSGTPDERSVRLREYAARAGPGIRLIAGGGVDEALLALLARTRSVGEVHVGRAAREGADPAGPVSALRVRRLRALADGSPAVCSPLT